MQETLNRLARHADHDNSNVMVIIDQVNEKIRSARLPHMYGHVLGRATEHPEMRRIVEPPMHVDSALSSNIQFADWVAACLGRAIHFHLVEDSPYGWVTSKPRTGHLPALHGAFTRESKLHLLPFRSVGDFHNSGIVRDERPLHSSSSGNRVGAALPPDARRRLEAMAQIRHAKQMIRDDKDDAGQPRA